jgi:hypothetical protein
MKLALLTSALLYANLALAADTGVDRLIREQCVAPLSHTASSCVVTDLDGDRDDDVAYSQLSKPGRGSHALTIYLGGADRPRQVMDLSAWPYASAVSTRDVDGDNDRDLIVSNGDRQAVAIFLNDGQGSFTFDTGADFLAAANAVRPYLTTPPSETSELPAADVVPPAFALMDGQGGQYFLVSTPVVSCQAVAPIHNSQPSIRCIRAP